MRRLGEQVHYVSRTGAYEVPAIVTATELTLNRDNVAAGYIPDLQTGHVHLTVFSPGPGGRRADATDFVTESPHGRNENQGGTYTEWDIRDDPHGGPGTFHDPLLCPFGSYGGVPGGR
ncbi:MAG TPA: hypothetical protein VFT75_02925 [Nocardioidaceae bacterium]|nr:hypothetical protein [Nocardioidaceae bacterium]